VNEITKITFFKYSVFNWIDGSVLSRQTVLRRPESYCLLQSSVKSKMAACIKSLVVIMFICFLSLNVAGLLIPHDLIKPIGSVAACNLMIPVCPDGGYCHPITDERGCPACACASTDPVQLIIWRAPDEIFRSHWKINFDFTSKCVSNDTLIIFATDITADLTIIRTNWLCILIILIFMPLKPSLLYFLKSSMNLSFNKIKL